MSSSLRSRLHRLEKARAASMASGPSVLGRYVADPGAYAREVLGVEWWAKQQEIAKALLTHGRVLVLASHKVGKTHVCAGLVNWFYDTFDPGACITTAPTAQHVRDVLWREIRLQRLVAGRGGFTGPEAPKLSSSPSHYAIGLTTAKGESFQGRHAEKMLFVLDEAVGVPRSVWEPIKSMYKPDRHYLLAICNPTDTSSQVYAEELSGQWHVIRISALDHPNLADELAGSQPRFPAAVSLAQIKSWIADWCEPVVDEPQPTDIEWPPGTRQWYRPGPLAECRMLGRWPSSTAGVWSDWLWSQVEALILAVGEADRPEIGCDPARFGDDFTAIHVRAGRVSLHHERANGWSTVQTAGRLKQLANEWCAWFNGRQDPNRQPITPQQITCKIDVDGLGGGVVDQSDGYAFVPVSAAATARHGGDFPNVRSELWFNTRWLAQEGLVSVARLSKEHQTRLRVQALAPTWRVDQAGRIRVELKEETKARLGASPDDMDAMNLAYWPAGTFTAPQPVPNPKRGGIDPERAANARRKLFGR